MDDILEKTTIHIDSDYASFISPTEFYVDIIDDIKNCIYIKTLKTEVFVKANYPKIQEGRVDDEYNVAESSYVENSIFNNKTTTPDDENIIERNVFNIGDYLYINLNDIQRINAISKKITVKTFDDIPSNINDDNYGLIWTKVDKSPIDYVANDPNTNNLLYYKGISDMNNVFASSVKSFLTSLRVKTGEASASDITDLNNIVTFTKQELINFGLPHYKSFFKQNNYYHEQDADTLITYRYVPTYIGYTKDNIKINKYTWDVIKNKDATTDTPTKVAETIKYVYNEGGPSLNPMNKVYNYKVKKEEFNTLRYYDSIYINKPTIHTNLLTSPSCYILSYKQELSGTSCGPNDTNTMVLNPILPELKRFNVKLTRINELGEHIDVPITNNGVFRVIMSFTIYYKRKKVTRA